MQRIQDLPTRVSSRFLAPLLLLGGLCLLPTGLKADDVPVRIVLTSANFPASHSAEGVIEAAAISPDGTGIAKRLRFRHVRVPGEKTVALDGDFVWRLSFVLNGLWCRDRVLGAGQRQAKLTVWKTGIVRGKIRVPPDRDDPQTISARFESAPLPDTLHGPSGKVPRTTVECPVKDGAFSCELPAAELDLRLRARGYISHYLWSVQVKAGEPVDIGRVLFKPGASVVGFVAADGLLKPKSVRVRLDSDVGGAARSPAGEARQKAVGLTTGVNGRGFFQLDGVAPGQYRLSATQPGFARASLHPVRVLPGSETSLQRPLLLERPLDIEIYLDPPQDPFGQPWTIGVRRFGEIPGVLDPVGEGAASSSGKYVASGLTPGRFVITASDSLGARFLWQEIELDHSSPPVFLSLDVIWLEGEVTLGDEPLEANLTFGGRNGPIQIPIKSDDDGAFGGFLPKGGSWDVFIESAKPKVARTVRVEVEPEEDDRHAEVDIALPDTVVRGKVSDTRGRAVPGAIVKATEMGRGAVTWETSDEDGRFSFHGFAEGALALDATVAQDVSSDPVVVQVSEHVVPPDVELVVHRRAAVHGSVVSSQGPVPGAVVMGIPKKGGLEYPFMLRPQAVTDIHGSFELHVPADADYIDIVVLPPGFALTTQRIAGVPEGPVQLPVVEHGGTLRLGFGAAADWQKDRRAPSPMVSYNGVILDSALLLRWARLKLADVMDPTRLVMPEMPPGDYTACWVTYQQLADLYNHKNGTSSPGRSCVSGDLSPYGVLDLSLKTGDTSSESKELK